MLGKEEEQPTAEGYARRVGQWRGWKLALRSAMDEECAGAGVDTGEYTLGR